MLYTGDFFSNFKYEPTDLQHASTIMFFTRWITHFCAPTFIFLSGTSAFLSMGRRTVKEQSWLLFTRGLWLIVLELTLVTRGAGSPWHPNPQPPPVVVVLNLVRREILRPPGRTGLDPAEDPLLQLRRQTDKRLLGELRVLAGQVVVAEHVLTPEPLRGKLRIRMT